MKPIYFVLALCLLTVTAAFAQTNESSAKNLTDSLFATYQVPEWFNDAKFGIWLHWGPQTIPATGGGWYARHMYVCPDSIGRETWGVDAWQHHRDTYGHQSEFGYKDLCHSWKAEHYDAGEIVAQFKTWGARYVAIIANHHDNFDLFNSSVHQWNSIHVGPKRDLLGEFAEAARKNDLKWVATIHTSRASIWFAPAFGTDAEGPLKGVPYDGNLQMEDGKGKWWEGMNPQQLYACEYPDFEKELEIRHLELVQNYQPDMLYFDDNRIPSPMQAACEQHYLNSFQKNGSNQAVISVKKPQAGTVLDYEKGVSEGILEQPYQSETTLAEDWFLKPATDGSSVLRHNARSLKELLADVISKNGTLMVNVAFNADGTIPNDQFVIMEELGNWIKGNSEAIYNTRVWKTYGEGGQTEAGHFKERGINSAPWDDQVLRFTRDKANKTLYVFVFGNPRSKTITMQSLAKTNLFKGKVHNVTLLGSGEKISWKMNSKGLKVKIPEKLYFNDCNVLKIETNGL